MNKLDSLQSLSNAHNPSLTLQIPQMPLMGGGAGFAGAGGNTILADPQQLGSAVAVAQSRQQQMLAAQQQSTHPQMHSRGMTPPSRPHSNCASPSATNFPPMSVAAAVQQQNVSRPVSRNLSPIYAARASASNTTQDGCGSPNGGEMGVNQVFGGGGGGGGMNRTTPQSQQNCRVAIPALKVEIPESHAISCQNVSEITVIN